MVKVVAEQSHITHKAAGVAIDTLFELLYNTVVDGNSFILPGLGSVSGRMRGERIGVDPRNGKTILCKEKFLVRFKSYFKQKDAPKTF